MAILAFQKPDKVIMLEGTDTVGRFEFRPLEPGFAQTIGNTIRRVLLSSLEGFAISSIRISGVDQEFAPSSMAITRSSQCLSRRSRKKILMARQKRA